MGKPGWEAELLIDAAARVIATRGFTAITLRDVAHAAGVGDDDVEAAFSRKDGLVTAIVDRAAALFTFPFDERPTVSGNRERLEALLMRQLGIVDENRDLFVAAILMLLRPADHRVIIPPLDSGLSRLEHYLVRFDEWLEASVTSRSKDRSTLTGCAAGGAVVGILTRWARHGGVERAKDWSRPLASMLVR